MKTIGLIGGMSWESSMEYYRIINEEVKVKLGGLHSAQSLMYSFDFEKIEQLQHAGNWEEATKEMIKAASHLEKGGAEFIVICTNTMHKMAQAIQEVISIPLLHIADATAEEVMKKNMKKIGLLGTKFTMEENFYKGRLEEKFGLEVVTPDEHDRKIVHDVIYDELCLGKIIEDSRKEYQRIISNMKNQGAEGVILGCTEIGLLVKEADSSLPVFDTTLIHAKKAVEFALKQ